MNGRQPYFVAMDFDGTIAATFEPSPRGMNVNSASANAIATIFGEIGIEMYDKLGGLKNREPGELIKLLQNAIGMHDQSANTLTELYVQQKLSYLTPEISTIWPRIYPGAKEFFQLAHRGELPIDIAIISSGHDSFIQSVFEINGIPLPNILVTSDILRSRKMLDRERYKPHPYQLAEAHKQWQRGRENVETYIGKTHGKTNMAYMGDDPIKDGGACRTSSHTIFICTVYETWLCSIS